jgi:dolichyl-phosphate beta-glucosyltransferase
MPPSLTVVVPVYNEERRLPPLLRELAENGAAAVLAAGATLQEILIVDDGSTDGTAALLAGVPPPFAVLTLDHNQGKGAAVRAGFRAAAADLVLKVDVDLSAPLADLPRLSRALESGADLVIGSRSIPGSEVLVRQPLVRELMGKTFNLILRRATGIPWRDTQCGFKLFRRERTLQLFELQRVNGFAFDAELCVNAHRQGMNVVEVPVQWTNNTDTRVRLFRSSAEMLVDVLRIARRARRHPPPRQ